MFPVTEQGEIDYEYMEIYMKKLEQDHVRMLLDKVL